jgi:hypothetical protein
MWRQKLLRENAMFIPLILLAIESSDVIALRTMKVMSGGSDAIDEAELMFSEKANAACEAFESLMAGASGVEILHRYRELVAMNATRLGKRGT